MRQLIGILCSTVLIATSACDRKPSSPPSPPSPSSGKVNQQANTPLSELPMTVDAQDVIVAPRVSPNSPRMMKGKFTIRVAQGNEFAVTPASVGGACLIAQFKGADQSCTYDSQCDHTVPGQPPKKWHGYCLPRGHIYGKPDTGTCWVKPSENYCLKGKGAGTWYTPDVDTTEVYTEAKKYQQNPPVKWQVLGCLNGQWPAGHTPPCALQVMHDAGSERTVP